MNVRKTKDSGYYPFTIDGIRQLLYLNLPLRLLTRCVEATHRLSNSGNNE